MKDLSRHYDNLSPHERFQLNLKATARGDDSEADFLNRTCPKGTYRMNETAYTSRHDVLSCFIASFLSSIEQARGKLMVYQGMKEAFEHLVQRADDEIHDAFYSGHFGVSEKRPSKKAEKSVKQQVNYLRSIANGLLAACRKGIMKRVKADFEAFDAACRERIGLDAKTVIAGVGASELITFLDWKEIEEAEDLSDFKHIEPIDETEYTQELYDTFMATWDENVENLE